jgi:hypothetical protein
MGPVASRVADEAPPHDPELDYPKSQDPGLAIGLCSMSKSPPLTMRTSVQTNHQIRTGMPISTMHSTIPIAKYNSPIQKVLIWNW